MDEDRSSGSACASGVGVAGSIPIRAIRKALKMVPADTLLGSQHIAQVTSIN